MKVAFDCSTAAFKQKTGTGVYVEELVLNYHREFPEDELTHHYRLSRRLKGSDFLLPIDVTVGRETFLSPWSLLGRKKYDIFHGLNSRLPLMVNAKKIATVHDLFSIFSKFSEEKFRKDQTAKLRKMIARADHIIVPASFTRTELINYFNLKSESISVVPQGVREIYLKPREKFLSRKLVREEFNLSAPFLLFVGTLEKRKNLVGLVRTYIELKKIFDQNSKNFGLGLFPDLVLVGHEGYLYSEIAKEIELSGLSEKIKILGFITEEALATLYNACEAFVYLSLEEGFGIPIIEAMACEAPVISGDTTSLPEAGGGHSWLVGPGEFEKAARLIAEVLKKSPGVLSQVAAAAKYARAETWRKVARSTRAVYTQVLEQN